MGILQPRREIYGRLAWLDELRLIAIVVMVVDHALLFFARDGSWPGVVRLTLTRCAEPLFVFVIAYLALYLKRSIRVSRWIQIVVVSTITSTALSRCLGYAVADVLASIAIVAPLLPWIFSLHRRAGLVLLYSSAALAALPLGLGGLVFDYSPFLILHQVILTQIHTERGLRSAALHGLVSLAILIIATGVVSLGVPPSASIVVTLLGHPIAALIIAIVQGKPTHWSTPLSRVAKRPLTLYALHLLGFAALAG